MAGLRMIEQFIPSLLRHNGSFPYRVFRNRQQWYWRGGHLADHVADLADRRTPEGDARASGSPSFELAWPAKSHLPVIIRPRANGELQFCAINATSCAGSHLN